MEPCKLLWYFYWCHVNGPALLHSNRSMLLKHLKCLGTLLKCILQRRHEINGVIQSTQPVWCFLSPSSKPQNSNKVDPQKTSRHVSDGKNMWVMRNDVSVTTSSHSPLCMWPTVSQPLSFIFILREVLGTVSVVCWGQGGIYFFLYSNLCLGGLQPASFPSISLHAPFRNIHFHCGCFYPTHSTFVRLLFYHTAVSSHSAHNLRWTLAWKYTPHPWLSYP